MPAVTTLLPVLFATPTTMPTLVGLGMTAAARMLATAATGMRAAATGARSGRRGVMLNLRLGLRVRRLSMSGLVVHRGLMARRTIRVRRGR